MTTKDMKYLSTKLKISIEPIKKYPEIAEKALMEQFNKHNKDK